MELQSCRVVDAKRVSVFVMSRECKQISCSIVTLPFFLTGFFTSLVQYPTCRVHKAIGTTVQMLGINLSVFYPFSNVCGGETQTVLYYLLSLAVISIIVMIEQYYLFVIM